MRFLLVGIWLICLFSFAVGQVKTVTNADLEKFKQQRIAAEKELRENYKEMGFKSPEEMKAEEAKNREELIALSEKLRAERLQREAQLQAQASEEKPVIIFAASGTNTSAENADFTDYSRVRATTVYYPNLYRRGISIYSGNSGWSNDDRRRGHHNPQPMGGMYPPRGGTRNQTVIGPDRRLTIQNKINSRQNDIRNLGVGVTVRPNN